MLTSELIDAIERLCAGDSVETVLEAGCESSRDQNLYEELKRLNLRVQERRAASLAREAPPPTNFSRATNKLKNGMSKRAETSSPTIGNNTSQTISARLVLEFILRSMAQRNLAWEDLESRYRVLFTQASDELIQMVRPLNHASLVESQEQWLQMLAGQPRECDVAEGSRTAHLDRTIDECLQLAEAQKVLSVIVEYLLDRFYEHQEAEEVTGVPSAEARGDLCALIGVAEDLRKVELNKTVWRLRSLGHHIPRRDLRFLLAGDLESFAGC